MESNRLFRIYDIRGERMDSELEKVRLKIYLRHLLPIKEDARTLDVSKVDFSKDVFVVSNKDLYRETFVLGLLALKKKRSYKVINAYRLIDIMVGNDLEYKAVSHIGEDILMVTLGYNEMENKRQIEVINQVIDIRRMSKKLTWIFYKGMLFDATKLGIRLTPVSLDKDVKSRSGGRLI